MTKSISRILLVLGTAWTASSYAFDAAGIRVPDTLTVNGWNRPLILNGAGIRKKFFISVYVGALYLDTKESDPEKILAATTHRVMRMQFLRNVGADALAQAWRDTIRANHNEDQARHLNGRLDEFNKLMPGAKPDDVVLIMLHPDGTTQLAVNGERRGAIGGSDFQRALLRAWIGSHPADATLKRSVLGTDKP